MAAAKFLEMVGQMKEAEMVLAINPVRVLATDWKLEFATGLATDPV